MKTSPMVGKQCYHHLGGKLGDTLFSFLVQSEWIVPEDAASKVYVITEKGYEGFRQMGLELPKESPTKTGV